MSEQLGYIHRPRCGEGGHRDLTPEELKDANQLTIFYAGSISVFEGVSPEKAQAIMLIAAAAAAGGGTAPLRSPPSVQSSNSGGLDRSNTPNLAPEHPISSIQVEIPLARRNSLQRFLEKRRERLANIAPYMSAAMKPVDMSPESRTGNKASSPADSFNNEVTGPY